MSGIILSTPWILAESFSVRFKYYCPHMFTHEEVNWLSKVTQSQNLNLKNLDLQSLLLQTIPTNTFQLFQCILPAALYLRNYFRSCTKDPQTLVNSYCAHIRRAPRGVYVASMALQLLKYTQRAGSLRSPQFAGVLPCHPHRKRKYTQLLGPAPKWKTASFTWSFL